MDQKYQTSNENEHAREAADGELSTKIAAMCDDFGQQKSNERERSSVSSAVLPDVHSGSGECDSDHAMNTEDESQTVLPSTFDNENSMALNRKQKVRLTTINPTTANIAGPLFDSSNSSSSTKPAQTTASSVDPDRNTPIFTDR
ncbi:hypothetical protein IWW48_005082 [Coemansia sp. RSA 1200]|nr:hypothetical protein IWW48_005082 [Coemansia sp. RSA 1200]